MVHEGEIEILQDRSIRPGSVWEEEIKRWREEADVFLPLVSEHYFHSKICTKLELSRALERAERRRAGYPCNRQPGRLAGTQIGRFNAFAADGHPGTKHADRGDAYVNVAQGLRRALEPSDLHEQEQPEEEPPPTERKTFFEASAKIAPPTGAAVRADVTAAYDYVRPATVFFRGRNREIAILRNVIRGGRNAAVFGLQRVGKTSFVEKAISSVLHDTSDPFPSVNPSHIAPKIPACPPHVVERLPLLPGRRPAIDERFSHGLAALSRGFTHCAARFSARLSPRPVPVITRPVECAHRPRKPRQPE